MLDIFLNWLRSRSYFSQLVLIIDEKFLSTKKWQDDVSYLFSRYFSPTFLTHLFLTIAHVLTSSRHFKIAKVSSIVAVRKEKVGQGKEACKS